MNKEIIIVRNRGERERRSQHVAIVGFFKFGAHFVDKMGASTVIDLFAKENKGFLPKKTLSPLPLGQGQVP